MKYASAIAGLCLLLAGCVGNEKPKLPPLEPVLTWYEEDGALVARVASNGCTNASSFEPYVYMSTDWVAEVELVRTAPDPCRGFFPNGTLVSWTREELAIPESADIRLVNPTRVRVPYAGAGAS